MLKVNIILYMNHVIHHIETPPGLTPPRLLAGGWEGKVLYVDSQHYVIIYEPRDSSYVESQYLELRHTKMRGSRISYSRTEPQVVSPTEFASYLGWGQVW